MQQANQHKVLGDFSRSEFKYFDLTNTFFRRDGKYWVRTDNADGDWEYFEVKYAYGVTPLQQYLVEFPDDQNIRSLPKSL